MYKYMSEDVTFNNDYEGKEKTLEINQRARVYLDTYIS